MNMERQPIKSAPPPVSDCAECVAKQYRIDALQASIDGCAQKVAALAGKFTALRSLPPQTSWQPIESAPKAADALILTDGVTVDVGGWVSAADQGAEPEEEFRIAAGWWFLHTIDMQPTHWMPLPSPPLPVAGRGNDVDSGPTVPAPESKRAF